MHALLTQQHHTACVCWLSSAQVIPRVNPVFAPTAQYVSEDRSRLLLRLDMYGLLERQVQGDGNCQVSRMMAARLAVTGYHSICIAHC
jgi:hypothetical protein